MSVPNVLFVVLDTARGETVLSGLHNGVMPATGRIAEEGTTFRNVMSVSPWTLPSHASLFTGQYTSDHGTHTGRRYFDPSATPLAKRLRDAGYTTAAISGNIWISPEFGFDAGFDQFSMQWDVFWDSADLSRVSAADGVRNRLRALSESLSPANAHKTVANALYGRILDGRCDKGAWLTTRRATRWIENRRSGTPFFLFINYLEPHLEYDPPAGYGEKFLPAGLDSTVFEEINQDPWQYIAGNVEMTDREFSALEALYKGELNYLDRHIGRLYRALSAAGILDETVIVVMSDHGENIGDHGLMDHQYCLYDTLLNVPLVVRYPDAFETGKETDAAAETRDLYPTILELAGVDTATDSDSVSTNSLVPGTETGTGTSGGSGSSPGRDRAIAEYLLPQPSMNALEKYFGELPAQMETYDRALRSIRTDDWKLIEGTDGSVELYDLSRDPAETTNLAADHPETLEELRTQLERERGPIRRGTDRLGTISDRSKQRLSDLGYL